MKQEPTITAKIANNMWLDLNNELGRVMSQLHTLQQEGKHLRTKMFVHEGTMHANDFEVPISWKKLI